jgi:hypothetical protein
MLKHSARLWARAFAACSVAAIGLGTAGGCGNGRGLVLTELVEARQLASDLRIQFSKAADASNRAVMAETDEASAAAAQEAKQAKETLERNAQSLEPILQQLGYSDDTRLLDEFNRRFAEYRTLDDTILELAVENTNLKAQRLSFGPAREAADAFRDSLQTIARTASTKDRWSVEALGAKATAAVREIQVLQAQHIPEADEAAMSRMETQMATLEAAARRDLRTLTALAPPGSGPGLAAAEAALDRFNALNAEIVSLSRRNSNVRSLALTLGRKRTLTAACDDSLQGLADALEKHEFTATR